MLRRTGAPLPANRSVERLVSLRDVGLAPPPETSTSGGGGVFLSPRRSLIQLQQTAVAAARRFTNSFDADDDDEDADFSRLLRSNRSSRVRLSAYSDDEMEAARRLLDGLDEGIGWSMPMPERSSPAACRTVTRHPLSGLIPEPSAPSRVYVSAKAWFSY